MEPIHGHLPNFSSANDFFMLRCCLFRGFIDSTFIFLPVCPVAFTSAIFSAYHFSSWTFEQRRWKRWKVEAERYVNYITSGQSRVLIANFVNTFKIEDLNVCPNSIFHWQFNPISVGETCCVVLKSVTISLKAFRQSFHNKHKIGNQFYSSSFCKLLSQTSFAIR